MRQEQFHRVGIHCEVQFIDGRLLRRTDLRREDVISDMLGKARGGSQIHYLEMLQQGFQLRELLFTGRHSLHRFRKIVEGIHLHWQIGKLCCLWDDPVIVENHDTLPAVRSKLLLRFPQCFSRRRQFQRDDPVIIKVGMKAKGEMEEVFRLFGQFLGAGRCGEQFAVLHHIAVPRECAVFTGTQCFADFTKVQHLEHIVGETVQFLHEAVFRIEAAQFCVTGCADHMAAIRTGADCQISHVLHGDNTAVGFYLSLDLQTKQAVKGFLLRFIQHSQTTGKIVQFVEAGIQFHQVRSEILEAVVVIDFQIQLLVLLKLHLIHCIVQFPRGGGQFQPCVGLTVGCVQLCQIDAKYLFSQGSSLPSAARSAGRRRDLHRGYPSRACFRTPWPTAAPVSHQAARCYNQPAHGSGQNHP